MRIWCPSRDTCRCWCRAAIRHEQAVRKQSNHEPERNGQAGIIILSSETLILYLFPFQFDIKAVTQRNTILEAQNLRYIDKHHLMQKMKDERELLSLAKRVERQVSERFLNSSVFSLFLRHFGLRGVFRSPYVTSKMIMRVIALFEVVFFFDEGYKTNNNTIRRFVLRTFMSLQRICLKNRQKVILWTRTFRVFPFHIMTDIALQLTAQIIENLMSNEQWQNKDFVIAMRNIGAEIRGVKPKLVLKILRQALTGMKVCSIYIISRILQLKLPKGWTTTCRDCPPD